MSRQLQSFLLFSGQGSCQSTKQSTRTLFRRKVLSDPFEKLEAGCLKMLPLVLEVQDVMIHFCGAFYTDYKRTKYYRQVLVV